MADEDRKLTQRLARRRRWAGAVVRLEALMTAFAPSLLVVAVFAALSLFGIWRLVPWWLHAASLAIVTAALAWSLARGARHYAAPDPAAVDRRLETSSGLRHRPIEALGDRPSATADATTRRLWQRHLERQRAALEALDYIGPRPVWSRLDPWALRAALGLVLVIAVVHAGPDWRVRLAEAFVPRPAVAVPAAPARVDLWLTPPLYTGAAPVVRSVELPMAPVEAPIVVPEGTELVIQIHDAAGTIEASPRYALVDLAVEELGAGSRESRTVLEGSGTLDVAATEDLPPLASFAIEVLPDNRPEVAFAESPRATHRGVLNPRFRARDDYGLAAIDLELALGFRPEASERLELRRLGRPVTELDEGTYLDLTPHPFAGQEVEARLIARDVADQEGTSATITFVLPERTFTNVLARAIIASRKQLVAEPDERRAVASQLNIMAQSPRLEDLEIAVPLTLRAASTRLVINDEGEADRSVVDLLWELAIYVEEGQFAVAERDLHELEKALREALERGADDAELQQLMDELEQAMEAFLDAMQQQALEQMQNLQPGEHRFQPVDPNAQMLDRQDFRDMLEQMREAMASGATAQAEQMLAQLRELLENLQTAMQMPMMSPMQQSMGALQDLIRRQQDLLDESFDMQQQRQPGEQGQQSQQGPTNQPGQPGQQGQGAPGLGQQQEALRRSLGDLMRQLGEAGQEIPRALGQSELQMRGAEQALNESRPGEAIGPQTDALDLLQQGAGQLMEQMQQQMGQGEQPGRPGPNAGMGPPLTETRDPLGRPLRNDGGASPFGVEVPDRPDLGTAREVLRELHRRAGERDRPPLELEYFERLLRRF